MKINNISDSPNPEVPAQKSTSGSKGIHEHPETYVKVLHSTKMTKYHSIWILTLYSKVNMISMMLK